MKKSRRSLAFKLNILITAIVLIVSLVLVTISYSTYTTTVFQPYYSRLEAAESFIHTEETQLQKLYDHFYAVTHTDNFEAYLAKAQAEGSVEEQVRAWLDGFQVNISSGALMRTEEYDRRMDALNAEAEQAGIPSEDFWIWLSERDPEIYGFEYSVLSEYSNHCAEMSGILDESGASRVTSYVESGGAYMHLLECIDTHTSREDDMLLWNYDDFGALSAEVEAIRIYLSQNAHEGFRLSAESGTELVKVVPLDANGHRIYFLFACDITEAVSGQKAFLLRSLALVALLEIAAITVSLLILRHTAIKPLRELAKAVGDFNVGGGADGRETIVEPDIRSNDEIGDLARDFRSMQTRILENTENLTRMTAEKERISTELELATRIQEDMLPNTFPPFPDRKEFDIYASMDPAKEVGGDFYDFFLLDDDHLALVMADVSGKGIPGALFMMISKIMVQNVAMTGLPPAKALEAVNRQIMVNNREEMFVTVWLGILEISTGRLTAANAGHEYPALMEPEGSFEIYKDRHGLVIGAIEGVRYPEYELMLKPGAKLFVYTDGLPEASDREYRQFGTERMLQALNEARGGTPEQILGRVQAAVDDFVGAAEQFDDLTMLCLEYRGKQ